MREIDANAERAFENAKVSGENSRSKQSKYYWATGREREEHLRRMESGVIGSKTLEIGCSTGSLAMRLAPSSKSYLGVDISDQAIAIAAATGIPNATFLCCDAHSVPQPDQSFDCVVVDALLHHLDLRRILPEIHRLLRADGVLYFNEPLGTNPFFGLYRKMTPRSRTRDERPFTRSDIELMKTYFHIEEIRWFGFLSIASAFLRYAPLRSVLSKVDHLLSRTPLRLVFWQIAGSGKKRG
jgi:SAM-dependent methyltransferase